MRNWIICAFLAASATTMSASVIFTKKAPGVQQTSVAGATTETFDSLPAGPLGAYNSPIGAYSVGGQIVNPDAFGGSGQTLYVAVGAQSGTT